jgi:hypothetical protein
MSPQCARNLSATGKQDVVQRLLEWTSRRVIVEVDTAVDSRLIDDLIAVERECCPFFTLDSSVEQRLLAVSVSAAEQERALDGVALSLGVQADHADSRASA